MFWQFVKIRVQHLKKKNDAVGRHYPYELVGASKAGQCQCSEEQTGGGQPGRSEATIGAGAAEHAP